jgi:geranylgeranyl diphosphate synthase type II
MSLVSEKNILLKYQERVENLIRQNLSLFGSTDGLTEACCYALTNGGKRYRPCLVLMVAEALGHAADVTYAALATEFFHTASLVADDLPCMDNEDQRRDKPSLHKVYGEATALLVTYALIAAGNECIAKNAQVIKASNLPFSGRADEIGILALQNAAYNSGIFGATGGQYIDIYPKDHTEATIREVILKKTVSLFENSFVFGWLYGGGPLDQLDKVRKAAYHFGMAFQIADDLGDMDQDVINQRHMNMANLFGKEASEEMFHVELRKFLSVITELPMNTEEFLQLPLSI